MTLTIRGKLFAGFAAVLVLTVAAAAVALLGMGKMDHRTARVVDADMPALIAAHTVSQQIDQFRSAQLAHSVSKTPKAMESPERSMTLLQDSVTRALGSYGELALGKRDRSLASEVQQSWTAYLSGTAGLVTAS